MSVSAAAVTAGNAAGGVPAAPVAGAATARDRDAIIEGDTAQAVAEVAAHVRGGGLAIVPTDTVYGIGSLASDARAVAAVLAAKGRGRHMPPPVLVADPSQVDALVAAVPPAARALMAACWPGALTLILDAAPHLGWDLGETDGTVALRMPDHPLTLALLAATGPLAVTSANHTGQPPATDAASGAAAFPGRVSVIPGLPACSDAAARPEVTTPPQPGLPAVHPGARVEAPEAGARAGDRLRTAEPGSGRGQVAERGTNRPVDLAVLAPPVGPVQPARPPQPDILLLDGGPTPGPVPSTIVTLAGDHAAAPAVLRDGVLARAALAAVLEPLRASVPGLDLSDLVEPDPQERAA